MSHSKRIQCLVLNAALLLSACGGDDDAPETPVSGQRISIMTFEQVLEADPQLDIIPVQLPQPYRNLNWPQSYGGPTKALHHLSLGERLTKAWSRRFGKGSGSTTRLITAPIIAEGFIYVIDTQATVVAMNASTGERIWSTKLEHQQEKRGLAFGGGVAYGRGRIFATTGYGFVVALDAVTGREIWRSEVTIPFRGAPTYADGRVYAVTHDNQLFAFSAEDGAELWDHVGIVETAGVMGSAAPSVAGDTVVAAYSSGELFALRAENGRVAWTDTLSRSGRLTALAALSDVDGDPVIDRGTVYALSHAGRMVAIDFASGSRVWEANIGGTSTPWVAGEFIFAVTTENEVVCMLRRDGRVRWVTQLQRYKDPEDRDGIIRWFGPVLASDRLVVVSTHGYVLTLSPYDGRILSGEKFGDSSFTAPIIANDTLYIITDDGEIVAYR